MMKVISEALRLRGYAPKTLLDIGAHLGTFTQEFLRVYPDCAPTLVEPNPFCQTDLAKLGFEKHAVAASSAEGEGEIFLTKEWLQSTGVSLYRENTPFFRDEVITKHKISKVRLDDLFRGRRFDFVKIDTQGSELDVIMGGSTILSQADYILVEVSLVEYNIGGAQAEAVFAKLTELGFHCTEVTDFHRLGGVFAGNLLQMDFLFERRGYVQAGMPLSPNLQGMFDLAVSLNQGGRFGDALLLLDHLDALAPGDTNLLKLRVQVLGASGQALKALEALYLLKSSSVDVEDVLGEVRNQMPAALECFNSHLSAGKIEEAEKYVCALAALLPGNIAILDSALSCNLALGRKQNAKKYATALLVLDPEHSLGKMPLADITAEL
jgi:FkbM family methyltransferase